MALYAFDGTGNEDLDRDTFDTNVRKIFDAYEDPEKNSDPERPKGSLYLRGIGTRSRTFVGRTFSEAFGIGGHRRVRQAMERLENNAESGDKIIDIAGFSRGGALALSFANEVASKMPGLSVRFMALFEVVGEFGLPGEHVNAGHNLRLPPNAQHVFHAMALDESRLLYPLTRLGFTGDEEGRLQEVWFRGTHSDVGGGNANTSLNWIPLDWMCTNALKYGLPIRQDDVASNREHETETPRLSKITFADSPMVPRRMRDTDLVHVSVVSSKAAFVGDSPVSIDVNLPLTVVDVHGDVLTRAPGP